MARIDYKITTWRRIEFDSEESLLEDLKNMIAKKKLDGLSDIFEHIMNYIDENVTDSTIDELEEFIKPENNDNYSTLEMFDDEDKLILFNGTKPGDDDFIPHGRYTMSNSGGYLIQISEDGEGARVRDNYGQDITTTSDWIHITQVINEDGDVENIIDPGEDGYNIPLSLVFI